MFLYGKNFPVSMLFMDWEKLLKVLFLKLYLKNLFEKVKKNSIYIRIYTKLILIVLP
jgi:hypothetical protein